jgi:hypothetical protein
MVHKSMIVSNKGKIVKSSSRTELLIIPSEITVDSAYPFKEKPAFVQIRIVNNQMVVSEIATQEVVAQ